MILLSLLDVILSWIVFIAIIIFAVGYAIILIFCPDWYNDMEGPFS